MQKKLSSLDNLRQKIGSKEPNTFFLIFHTSRLEPIAVMSLYMDSGMTVEENGKLVDEIEKVKEIYFNTQSIACQNISYETYLEFKAKLSE